MSRRLASSINICQLPLHQGRNSLQYPRKNSYLERQDADLKEVVESVSNKDSYSYEVLQKFHTAQFGPSKDAHSQAEL